MAPEILPLFEQRKVALEQTRQAAMSRADQLTKRIGEMKKLVQAAVPSAEARVVEADNRVRAAQQKVEQYKIDVHSSNDGPVPLARGQRSILGRDETTPRRTQAPRDTSPGR